MVNVMEDFSLDAGKKIDNTDTDKPDKEAMFDMRVSPICEKDGKKLAYVSFSGNGKSAEGVIPECCIIKNNGFTGEEVEKLEEYMSENLPVLKGLAKSVNVLDAFMK